MIEIMRNMYSFYTCNGFKLLHEWTLESYGTQNGAVLMCSFLKFYKKDKKLQKDFQKYTF